MKQVLFIGMTTSRGGIESFMLNVFLRLEGRGYHFTFLNIYNKTLAYQSVIKRHGGNIINWNIHSSFIGHLFRYNDALKFFYKYHNFDIVHVNAVTLNVLFWLKAAAKFHIKKLIIHSHNSGIKRNSFLISIFSYLLSKFNTIYLKFHTSIIKLAASKSCGQWMFGRNSKFIVINNGIDTNLYKFNPNIRRIERNKLGIPLSNKVIITTSRLEPQKNYPKLINVFKELHKIDNSIKLLIVGNGTLMNYVKHLVASYNLCDCIYFLGSKPQNCIIGLLNASDLMIMPSFFEAVPFSLTEAQSTGVPALVSLHAIPSEANITGKLKYLSLKEPDIIWAKYAWIMLNDKMNDNIRLEMNDKVYNSKYNLVNSIKSLNQIYC